MEKEILALKSKEHLTFREAKQRVLEMYISPGVTFASVLQTSRSYLTNRTNADTDNRHHQLHETSQTTTVEHNSTVPSHESFIQDTAMEDEPSTRGSKRLISPIKAKTSPVKKHKTPPVPSSEWTTAHSRTSNEESINQVAEPLSNKNRFANLGSLESLKDTYLSHGEDEIPDNECQSQVTPNKNTSFIPVLNAGNTSHTKGSQLPTHRVSRKPSRFDRKDIPYSPNSSGEFLQPRRDDSLKPGPCPPGLPVQSQQPSKEDFLKPTPRHPSSSREGGKTAKSKNQSK